MRKTTGTYPHFAKTQDTLEDFIHNLMQTWNGSLAEGIHDIDDGLNNTVPTVSHCGFAQHVDQGGEGVGSEELLTRLPG